MGPVRCALDEMSLLDASPIVEQLILAADPCIYQRHSQDPVGYSSRKEQY
jgi:hypothetical protein